MALSPKVGLGAPGAAAACRCVTVIDAIQTGHEFADLRIGQGTCLSARES